MELRICENGEHRLICEILHIAIAHRERPAYVPEPEAATVQVCWARRLLCPPRGTPTAEEKSSLAMDMQQLQKAGVFPRKLKVTTNMALSHILVKACKNAIRKVYS